MLVYYSNALARPAPPTVDVLVPLYAVVSTPQARLPAERGIFVRKTQPYLHHAGFRIAILSALVGVAFVFSTAKRSPSYVSRRTTLPRVPRYL